MRHTSATWWSTQPAAAVAILATCSASLVSATVVCMHVVHTDNTDTYRALHWLHPSDEGRSAQGAPRRACNRPMQQGAKAVQVKLVPTWEHFCSVHRLFAYRAISRGLLVP